MSNGYFYAEYDDVTLLWCVFHTDKGEGKAYASFAAQEDAEVHVLGLNYGKSTSR